MKDLQFSVAAIGSVLQRSTFSGTPYHFWASARALGYNVNGWDPDMSLFNYSRRIWNVVQLLKLQRAGGYQYSKSFEQKLISQIPDDQFKTSIISFNQHFPSPGFIHKHGGKLSYYIDATTKQLFDRYGVRKHVGSQIADYALKTELENFKGADHIFTMQQWAKDSVVNDYSISPDKVHVVLPGANIMFDAGYRAKLNVHEEFSSSKPLVLGFVGKDWKRKGLLLLADVRDELERRGFHALVRCAGYTPPEFGERKGVEFVGFIDKGKDNVAFMNFLESCDIGCLFSEAEFSSISVLEFISTGRPAAGFTVDGMGDLFLPDASIRFKPGETVKSIADGFERYVSDEKYRVDLNTSAVARSEYVRWPRSVEQVMKVLTNG